MVTALYEIIKIYIDCSYKQWTIRIDCIRQIKSSIIVMRNNGKIAILSNIHVLGINWSYNNIFVCTCVCLHVNFYKHRMLEWIYY